MNTDSKDEMRAEYLREDLGKGVRGKYLKQNAKGTNLVLLDDKVAKAFPTAEAVNEALLGLLAITEQTARLTGRSGGAWGKAAHRLETYFRGNQRCPLRTQFACLGCDNSITRLAHRALPGCLRGKGCRGRSQFLPAM